MKFGAATHSDRRGPTHSTRSSVSERPNLAPKPSKLLSFCLLFFFLTGSALALDPSRLISQYGHTTWRIADGYFGGVVTSIAQTADGYLWVGTQAGLWRFDGVRFVLWNPPAGEQLPSSQILSLLAARDGSLWIASMGGLSHWVNQHLVVVSKQPVGQLVEDHDLTIWFVRYAGQDAGGSLCHVTVTGVQCYGKADGIPAIDWYDLLAEDPQGNLWLGASTVLVRWKAGSSTVYRPKGLKEQQAGLVCLAFNPDGSMLVGMAVPGRGLGLQQLASGAWKPFERPGLDGTTLHV